MILNGTSSRTRDYLVEKESVGGSWWKISQLILAIGLLFRNPPASWGVNKKPSRRFYQDPSCIPRVSDTVELLWGVLPRALLHSKGFLKNPPKGSLGEKGSQSVLAKNLHRLFLRALKSQRRPDVDLSLLHQLKMKTERVFTSPRRADADRQSDSILQHSESVRVCQRVAALTHFGWSHQRAHSQLCLSWCRRRY